MHIVTIGSIDGLCGDTGNLSLSSVTMQSLFKNYKTLSCHNNHATPYPNK